MLIDFLVKGEFEFAFPSRKNSELSSYALSRAEAALASRGFTYACRATTMPTYGRHLMQQHGYLITLGFRRLSAQEKTRVDGILTLREEEMK